MSEILLSFNLAPLFLWVFLLLPGHPRYSLLRNILAAAGLGAFLSGIIQQKGFPYHFYPLKATSAILTMIVFLSFIEQAEQRTNLWRARQVRAVVLTLFSLFVFADTLRRARQSVDMPRDTAKLVPI